MVLFCEFFEKLDCRRVESVVLKTNIDEIGVLNLKGNWEVVYDGEWILIHNWSGSISMELNKRHVVDMEVV